MIIAQQWKLKDRNNHFYYRVTLSIFNFALCSVFFIFLFIIIQSKYNTWISLVQKHRRIHRGLSLVCPQWLAATQNYLHNYNRNRFCMPYSWLYKAIHFSTENERGEQNIPTTELHSHSSQVNPSGYRSQT